MRFCDAEGRLVAPHPDEPDPRGRSWRSRGEAPEGQGWSYPEEADRSVDLRVCPFPQRPTWWPDVWEAYQLFEKGHLLWPGGVESQSRPYLLIMRFIASTLSELFEAKLNREDE